MIRRMIIANVLMLFGIGSVFAPVAVSATPVSGHSANSTGHVAPFRHHRVHRYFSYAPYYYSYDDGADDIAPPPPPTKPVAETPVTENRRGCEPQIYSVPSSAGSESQITILRC